MPKKQTQKAMELALQGGGAHSALAWGVLDRLIEEPRLRIEGVSGPEAARSALEEDRT